MAMAIQMTMVMMMGAGGGGDCFCGQRAAGGASFSDAVDEPAAIPLVDGVVH